MEYREENIHKMIQLILCKLKFKMFSKEIKTENIYKIYLEELNRNIILLGYFKKRNKICFYRKEAKEIKKIIN